MSPLQPDNGPDHHVSVGHCDVNRAGLPRRASMTDLCQLSARELIRLMSGGSVSCREVVQAHLARIDAVNPTLNALVEATDAQQCLAAADEADQRVARGA